MYLPVRKTFIESFISITLYISLPEHSKEQIKQAVSNGEISLIPNYNNKADFQLNTVRKILGVVAKDSSIHKIARMLQINTHMQKCFRKNKYSVKTFAARIKAHAFAI